MVQKLESGTSQSVRRFLYGGGSHFVFCWNDCTDRNVAMTKIELRWPLKI